MASHDELDGVCQHPALKLTPEVASLVGAFIGASAAIIPALLTNRATRALERDHRLWERRIDAVEETYRAYGALATARRTAVSRKKRPSDQEVAWPLQDDAKAAGVKLALYGRLETSVAFEEAFNAWAKWYMAMLGWHVHERVAGRWAVVEELAKRPMQQTMRCSKRYAARRRCVLSVGCGWRSGDGNGSSNTLIRAKLKCWPVH